MPADEYQEKRNELYYALMRNAPEILTDPKQIEAESSELSAAGWDGVILSGIANKIEPGIADAAAVQGESTLGEPEGDAEFSADDIDLEELLKELGILVPDELRELYGQVEQIQRTKSDNALLEPAEMNILVDAHEAGLIVLKEANDSLEVQKEGTGDLVFE